MRVHVETLFTHHDAGRLLAVNDPGGALAPRLFLGRTADGNVWRFRRDVNAALAYDLLALCESQSPGLEVESGLDSAAPFVNLLSRESPVSNIWRDPRSTFPLIYRTMRWPFG